ncbi:MAG: hypothetical protein Q9174_002630 [Haloplaca sp. 1 TL-2023]
MALTPQDAYADLPLIEDSHQVPETAERNLYPYLNAPPIGPLLRPTSPQTIQGDSLPPVQTSRDDLSALNLEHQPSEERAVSPRPARRPYGFRKLPFAWQTCWNDRITFHFWTNARWERRRFWPSWIWSLYAAHAWRWTSCDGFQRSSGRNVELVSVTVNPWHQRERNLLTFFGWFVERLEVEARAKERQVQRWLDGLPTSRNRYPLTYQCWPQEDRAIDGGGAWCS